jgi:broad specificity phosphatase PhoE
MLVPVDLLLVRHGESESNWSQRQLKKNRPDLVPAAYYTTPDSAFRLTRLGRLQAEQTGAWIRERSGVCLSVGYASPFARAAETAALLGLPVSWEWDELLAERSWGAMVKLDPSSQAEERKQRKRDPLFWTPPNGDQLAYKIHQVRTFLDRVSWTHHKDNPELPSSAVVVCHGETMWAFRFLIEKWSPATFNAYFRSSAQEHDIRNGQVIHYTRRDPESTVVAETPLWVRTGCPSDDPSLIFPWSKVSLEPVGNAELLAYAESFPSFLPDS